VRIFDGHPVGTVAASTASRRKSGDSEHEMSRRLDLCPTRRGFLACVGAGVVVSNLRQSDAAALPELSFIVVSDTHLGYRDQDSAAKLWNRTAAEIAGAEGDVVLHLGDVVDGGREPQYAVYLEGRKAIRKPVHEIPGNHDPQELFARHIRKAVDTAFDHKGVRFVLFNNSRFESHDGFISPDQMKWIDGQCSAAAKAGLFVILCTHVPVHTNKNPDRGWYVKPESGQTEFYKLVERHRDRVLALLHGHFHNGVRGWDDRAPVQEVCFPSALYNQDRGLSAAKAEGYNLPEFRPGYVLVAVKGGVMTMRYKPVGENATAEKSCRLAR
jgi:3',5'-cyclic AMP phosphodiesterase CpdA